MNLEWTKLDQKALAKKFIIENHLQATFSSTLHELWSAFKKPLPEKKLKNFKFIDLRKRS